MEDLRYDLETGDFHWRRTRCGPRRNSTVAGCLNSQTGYINIALDLKRYQAHRLVWLYNYGVFPEGDLDHINRNRADNRLSNLREATRTQNLRNSSIRSNNTSGYKGVTWVSEKGKWRAQIFNSYKIHHLGYFDDIEKAAQAYDCKARELFGEFYAEGVS